MIGVRQGRHNFRQSPPKKRALHHPKSLTLFTRSVVDAIGKDHDSEASVLYEQSADRNRHPAHAGSMLARQPPKVRAELRSGSKTPFWGLLKGFVADLMHVAGGSEP